MSGRPPRPGPAPALAADLVADVSGHGPAVVLLHGQPGSAGDWDAVVGALAGEVTTIVPDRPGYGRTGGRAGGFGANAAAVERLLDEQGVDRAVLVGHSWGGGVAITLAGTRPDRVAGLVLVASVGPDEPVTPVDRILATWPVGDLVAAVALGGTGRLLTVPAVRRHLLPRLPDPARTVLASLRRPAGTAHLWRSFADEQRSWLGEAAGLTAALAGVSAPVTVVTGTADHVVDPAVAARLAAAVDGAVLVEVPGVGHLLPFDAPGAVADAVRATARRAGLS